jgi:hypothetical protein
LENIPETRAIAGLLGEQAALADGDMPSNQSGRADSNR